jgi:crotonobetainyl-CoA:carnitine CoA-transferase CaiB-like acyl-CoA transferase
MTSTAKQGEGTLAGIRVLDISHQYSGALAASMLGDLGADVLAVEHPSGSPIRTMLPKKDGDSVWWKVTQRNKRAVTLNLSSQRGQAIFTELAAQYDIVIENFRPGTMEKWGIGPDDLKAVTSRLVMVRISGYGQTGPYRLRPGYGTVSEALSGFAHLNGFPDRPPALPSVTLADGVTAVFAVVGALAALRARDTSPVPRIEVVDVSLLESLVRIIPNQVTVLQQMGLLLNRQGNSLIEKGVLRDLYQSRDGRYFVIGGGIGSQSMAKTLAGVGADELRQELLAGILHQDDAQVRPFLNRCNQYIHAWAAKRDYAEIDAELSDSGVVYGPIYDANDLINDPHVKERGVITTAPDEGWGEILMPAPVPRIAGRHHPPRHAGRSRGADNAAVFGSELGLSDQDLRELARESVI